MEIELSENLESKKGHWEFLRAPKSNVVEFSYWKEDSDVPDETIDTTVDEFNDLIEFMKTLKPMNNGK